MKKGLLLLAAIVFTCTTTFAQKYGHVNTQEIFAAMPGADSLQTKLKAFEAELTDIYAGMVSEFQTKKEKFDQEAGTMSSTVRQYREKELLDLQQRIMEFQEGVQNDMQEKQLELMQPFQDKILKAIEDVAKENGYAYIFDTQVLLYSEGGEDVSALVKKKLGIK